MFTHPLRITAIALAVLAGGALLLAQDRGPGPGRRQGEGRGPAGQRAMGRGLNLSDTQRTQMKAIRERHQAAIQAKVETATTARKALREAMMDPAADAKALKTLHEKVSAAQFEVMMERRALRQEILPLLTPEQKVQFEKRWMGMGRSEQQDY